MKLFFEEYSYPEDLLKKYICDGINISYSGNNAKVSCVGYFFNADPDIRDMVFIMPKVFISRNKLAFDRYNPVEIADISPENNPLKANGDDEVVFELSAWLYQALSRFFERNQQSRIGSNVEIQSIRPMGEKGSKTIIETILSLREFHKKHKNLFTYISLIQSSGNNKVHWGKTISKVQPVFNENSPVYVEFRNKNKVFNYDEELIVLFYSVLNYLEQTYHFKFQPAAGYTILKPSKIKSMIESGKGTRLLKKIRRNYFTDELVELWNLTYAFFERAEAACSGKSYREMLLVSNFNIVFEDMIDQLVSDERKDIPQELWEQQDGKIVDHIYKDRSIIENDSNIYFIGDSKYYKETSELGENSIYKQFTYAKNVIQYNINLFNNEPDNDSSCCYRDQLTEGYNITPNFFIRGNIDFDNPQNQDSKIEKDESFERYNKHFENRLFDRDTLFLQSYNINFMFVVASYVRNSDDTSLKKSIRTMFRNNFIEFIENRFDFSVLEPQRGTILTNAVERHFKKLIGKIYKPQDCDNLLIMALDKDEHFQLENMRLRSNIGQDFNIYEYHLGDDPNEVVKINPYRKPAAADPLKQGEQNNILEEFKYPPQGD